MGTSRETIEAWIERGKEKGAAYMIVVCDTYDWDDYAVFVNASENLQANVASYSGPNMQKVMEVYDLNADIAAQLKMGRARADLTA